jgi:hypothetical protein
MTHFWSTNLLFKSCSAIIQMLKSFLHLPDGASKPLQEVCSVVYIAGTSNGLAGSSGVRNGGTELTRKLII